MSHGLTKSRKTAASTPEVPDKLYFRIGEVARICDVQAYVLRFWETEFPQLKPNKGGTGQRLYRKRDVELALKIKRLLYEQGFTIAGARQALMQEKSQARDGQAPLPFQAGGVSQAGVTGSGRRGADARLRQIRTELEQIVSLLSQPRPVIAGSESKPKRPVLAKVRREPELFGAESSD